MHGLFPEPVLTALHAAPDEPAIERGGVIVSRGELLLMVQRIAGAMHEAGLRRGIGVGVLLPLTPQAYAAHLAAHALGCRVAPGFSDRVIFRELFPHGLTMLDLPVKGFPMPLTMSHIAARQEVRELLTMLRLPGLEKAATGG